MPNAESKLVTSEMMANGMIPLLFTGGACNIQGPHGPERNPGRDPLAEWLNEQEWSYYDPQIHPSTHGRDYVWGIDGRQEKIAREQAKLRVYEITATTIAAITMMEIMDDARKERTSIIWFNQGQTFEPIGIGNYDQIKNDEIMRWRVGQTIHSHLVAYVNAGRQLRTELPLMLADCPHIVFINSFDDLKKTIEVLVQW